MARVTTADRSTLPLPVREAFEKHVSNYQARFTNTKATLAHSLPAFEAYLQWYPLYNELELAVGKDLACKFAYCISKGAESPVCYTFFRKVILDNGQDPDNLQLSASDKQLLAFGSCITRCQGHIADHVYNPVAARYTRKDLVTIIAFAGQMIATSVLNNVLETDVDDFLVDYLPPVKSIWKTA